MPGHDSFAKVAADFPFGKLFRRYAEIKRFKFYLIVSFLAHRREECFRNTPIEVNCYATPLSSSGLKDRSCGTPAKR